MDDPTTDADHLNCYLTDQLSDLSEPDDIESEAADPDDKEPNLRDLAATVVNRLPDYWRRWIDISGIVFICDSGEFAEHVEVRVPVKDLENDHVTLPVIYLSEELIYLPDEEAQFLIANKIVHAWLKWIGDSIYRNGRSPAERKANMFVRSFGFTVPPDQHQIRRRNQ